MSIMTVGQAIVKFLDNQYVELDGVQTKFVDGVFTIFGHGIVVGLGQALDENPGSLRVYQGRNEQGMAHVATGFARQNNRRKIIACASSIGPGAANMVTAAATASNLSDLLDHVACVIALFEEAVRNRNEECYLAVINSSKYVYEVIFLSLEFVRKCSKIRNVYAIKLTSNELNTVDFLSALEEIAS